jgi:hypothetical protein
MAFVVVTRANDRRAAVEETIRHRYLRDYGAQLRTFPDLVVAEVQPSGDIDCAAGLRSGDQPLFAENYLDLSIELALRRESGRSVNRTRVVEVCHLVAPRAGHALSFVRRVIEFVRQAEVEWAIFTATSSLRHLLRRNGVNMIELACAEQGRVPNPEDWGSYFRHDPRVMAVSHVAVAEARRPVPVAAVSGHFVHA